MKLNKVVVNFFKSKSVVDFVYLVMMILIVTMIKDMIVSMYKKRKDKQWLNQAFGKTKGKKNVEGFTGTGWTTANCGSEITDISTGSPSVCDRLKFLLCDSNFDKLGRLLNGITTSLAGSGDLDSPGFHIKTNGGSIYTTGGVIKTGGGFISTNGGEIKLNGGDITMGTGDITTTGRITGRIFYL